MLTPPRAAQAPGDGDAGALRESERGGYFEALRALCDALARALAEGLAAGAARLGALPAPLAAEARTHLALAGACAEEAQRTDAFARAAAALERYLAPGAAEAGPCALLGAAGSGKTTLLGALAAAACARAEAEEGACVVVRFVGATPAASALRPLLARSLPRPMV